MNAVLYARVSTDKQAEKDLSIPAQLQAMREYARKNGWTVSEEFVEPGASARTTERPMLQRMLSRCKDTTARIDVVVVHKVDRLARDLYGHATIKMILKQRGIRLASVVENVDDSITGQLVENIMASLAEFYSANLGEEVKKAQRVMVDGGSWPHQAPRGYRLDRDPQGKSIVVPNEQLAPAIAEAFDLYATGRLSLSDISDELLLRGVASGSGKRVPISNIRTMLENPFYIGRMKWNGAEYSGRHEGIVDLEVFERVQAILRHRLKHQSERGRTRYLLRGVATCGDCGYRVTAERHRRWHYYRCIQSIRRQCEAPGSPVAEADAALVRVYRELVPSAMFRELLLTEFRKACDRREKRLGRDAEILRRQRARLLEREIKLTETFVAGEMSQETYRTLGGKLRRSISALDADLAEDRRPTKDLPAKTRALIVSAAAFAELHNGLDLPRRQQLLTMVFQRVVLDRGRIVDFTLRPPFDVIFKSPPTGGSRGTAAEFEHPTVGPAIQSLFEFDFKTFEQILKNRQTPSSHGSPDQT